MRFNRSIFIFFLLFFCGSAYALDNFAVRAYFYKADYSACIQEGQRLLAGAAFAGRDELYALVGLSALKQGDWRLSSDMFTRLLKEYSRSPYADEARLGLGDALSVQGDLRQARGKYIEFIEKRPSSKLKAQAYYRIFLLAKKAGDRQEEQLYRQKLAKEFPDSAEAKLDTDIFPAPKYGPASIESPKLAVSPATVVKKHIQSDEEDIQLVLAAQAYYSVQVGAFSKLANAVSFCEKLKGKGLSAFIDDLQPGGKTIYKVKVGKLTAYSDAKKLERRLSAAGYSTKLVP